MANAAYKKDWFRSIGETEMKQILMFIIPDVLPVLKETERFGIVYKKGLPEENIAYVLKYYHKLGASFEERYNRIIEHEKKNSKLPIFFNDIRIHFVAEDC